MANGGVMGAIRGASCVGVVLWAVACATTPQPQSSERAGAEPVALAYADAGSGPPVVLVHGAYGDLRTFRRALPILVAGHRLIVPSLRYHWPNPWPGDEEAYRAYTTENHARDLASLIERLGVAPVDLVAHSYGGNAAVVLALSRPDLVRRLVLLEPALGWMLKGVPGGEEILAQGTYAGARREALLARLRGGEAPISVLRSLIDGAKPGTFDALPADGRMRLSENARLVGPYATRPGFEDRFTCDDARRVRPPTLVVRGEGTGASFRAIAERFVSCAADARAVTVPGSGHNMQTDAPEAVAREIVRFLDG